jgi:hypothetical protein
MSDNRTQGDDGYALIVARRGVAAHDVHDPGEIVASTCRAISEAIRGSVSSGSGLRPRHHGALVLRIASENRMKAVDPAITPDACARTKKEAALPAHHPRVFLERRGILVDGALQGSDAVAPVAALDPRRHRFKRSSHDVRIDGRSFDQARNGPQG